MHRYSSIGFQEGPVLLKWPHSKGWGILDASQLSSDGTPASHQSLISVKTLLAASRSGWATVDHVMHLLLRIVTEERQWVWLTARLGCAQAGQREVFMDKLPGFPDGISTSSSGSFWVGLVVPKMPIVAWLESRCGFHAEPLKNALNRSAPLYVALS